MWLAIFLAAPPADEVTPADAVRIQYSTQRFVYLDVGESHTFRLKNGSERRLRLKSVAEQRDSVIGLLRRADVAVEIDGKPLDLVCEPYRMPAERDGLRIAADTTSGWVNIPKRVQFSLGDASDPIIDVRRFAASSTLRHVQGSQGCCGRIYLGRHPQPTTPHQMYSAGRLHLDSLLGPLPQAAAIYRERSPLRFADRIRRPLAVFQGEIDKVVPRHQSDAIEHFYRTVEALLRQHVLFA